jgi:hypothetical protein
VQSFLAEDLDEPADLGLVRAECCPLASALVGIGLDAQRDLVRKCARSSGRIASGELGRSR